MNNNLTPFDFITFLKKLTKKLENNELIGIEVKFSLETQKIYTDDVYFMDIQYTGWKQLIIRYKDDDNEKP
jgi:hypothetical protein